VEALKRLSRAHSIPQALDAVVQNHRMTADVLAEAVR
jgi:hypothetical protein